VKKNEFLELMKFPKEWLEWGMYPDELFNWQVENYLPGHEMASEHDRNGAFHWWLRRNPNIEQLQKLEKLAGNDPDHFLSADVLSYISEVKNNF
jgi:hypothetical protein